MAATLAGCRDSPSPPSSTTQQTADSTVDTTNETSNSAEKTKAQLFIEAALQGDAKTVTKLIKDGADIDSRYSGSGTAFRGDDGGYPIAASKWTALHAAASALNADIVKILIDSGANLDLDDGHGATALYMSVDVYDRENQKDECALLLIKAGAKVNTKTGIYIDGIGGHSPLHHAVAWHQKRAINALIAAGANVNAQDDSGGTPLHTAYSCDANDEIVSALLDAGADKNLKDSEGRPPTHWE